MNMKSMLIHVDLVTVSSFQLMVLFCGIVEACREFSFFFFFKESKELAFLVSSADLSLQMDKGGWR